MSRIGKAPIAIPEGVQITIEGGFVTVKGPKGELKERVDSAISVQEKDGEIIVERPSETKRNKSLHGLYRSLIQNMVLGVTQGYEKKLSLVGVGYRANKEGKKLTMQLGYSHPVIMEDPDGITVEVPQEREILVKGIDKQLVGNYAAKIRAWRKPEPYKGKGIRYADENVRRKEGKTGK